MRAAIINPASASGRTASRWRSIVSRIEAHGVHIEVQLTRGPGDGIGLTRRLLQDGFHDFIILGGDGTIGEVVAGCVRPDGSAPLRNDITISVIHQGTGGDLARSLGIPKEEDRAIDVALTGDPLRIDVGIAKFAPSQELQVQTAADSDNNGDLLVRGFITTSNIGMAAEVVEQASGRLKKLGNNFSFGLATMRCIGRNRSRSVSIAPDGAPSIDLDVVNIDVCNSRFMGGGMLVAPAASPNDGLLDVVIISAAARTKLLRAFPKIYQGTHVEHPLVRVEKVKTLSVDTPVGSPAQGVVLDGELIGTTPVTYSVLPSAISVRCPQEG